MRGYFGLGQLSPSEKSDILDQHRQIYNGYKTMLPQVSNTQPLYTQDYANDKNGITVNNKGEVKHYMNFGINEQVEKSQVCNECGSGYMEEGVCNECGSSYMEEETGHLDDIYNVEDFDPKAGFDYIEGPSNDVDTFEGMHKNLYEDGELDELGTHELEKGKKYKYNSPSFNDELEFDDEFEDKKGGEKMYKFKGKDDMGHLMPGKHIEDFVGDLEEQGGNAADMDVDDVDSAFNFDSNGPMDGGDVYPVTEEGNMDDPEITYDTMESAWMDEEESFDDLINMDSDIESESDSLEQMESSLSDEELDEVDISGSQGVYGDMGPAYDFDSEGPGKGGPYQEYYGQTISKKEMEEQYPKKHEYRKMIRQKNAEKSGEDFDADELDISDYQDNFDPETSSWEDITKITGDDEFGYVDEDIRESLIIQKNRIMEMMNRMSVIK